MGVHKRYFLPSVPNTVVNGDQIYILDNLISEFSCPDGRPAMRQ